MENGYKLSTLKFSAIAISSVVMVEVTLGIAVGSLAIVSDGLHALLDTLTTVILFAATRASLKPPDEEHMYGHEKFESIGGLIGGIALVGVALLIMYEAIVRLFQRAEINFGLESAGFIAVGFTFCIDFFRVGIFRRARKSESSTLRAGLYHAVADLSSTVIAFIGFGLATLRIYYGDALASMMLSVMLSYLSARLVWTSGMELSDTVSKDVIEKVRKEMRETKIICGSRDLRVRKAGSKTFVEATLQVPEYVSLEEAHDVASKLETRLKASLGNADVILHIEPCETDVRVERQIEQIAVGVEGVKETHEINTSFAEGKLYITLHVRVDPRLSIDKADEIAEKIENMIEKQIKDVEDIAVHVEPFNRKVRKGAAVNEGEVRKIVHEIAQNYPRAFRVKRIVTYILGKKRYINIDCIFFTQISIEEAHAIASQIEEKIKEHFAETTVTVHMKAD